MGLLDQAHARAAELEEEERLAKERKAEEALRRAREEQDAVRHHLRYQFGIEPELETVNGREYWIVDDLVFLVRQEHAERYDPDCPSEWYVTYLVVVVPEPAGTTTLRGRRCYDVDSLARVVRADREATVHRDGVLARLANGGYVEVPSSRH